MIRFIIYRLISGTLLHVSSSGNIQDSSPLQKLFTEHKSFLVDNISEQNKNNPPQHPKNETIQESIDEGNHPINDVARGSVSLSRDKDDKNETENQPNDNDTTIVGPPDKSNVAVDSVGRGVNEDSAGINASARGEGLSEEEKSGIENNAKMDEQQEDAKRESFENASPEELDQLIKDNQIEEEIEAGTDPEDAPGKVAERNGKEEKAKKKKMNQDPDSLENDPAIKAYLDLGEPIDPTRASKFNRRLTLGERRLIEEKIAENKKEFTNVEKLRITTQMCHSLANTLHFDAYQKAMDQNTAEKKEEFDQILEDIKDAVSKRKNLQANRKKKKKIFFFWGKKITNGDF